MVKVTSYPLPPYQKYTSHKWGEGVPCRYSNGQEWECGTLVAQHGENYQYHIRGSNGEYSWHDDCQIKVEVWK